MFGLTILLGTLIAADVALGLAEVRLPFGISLALVAAVLGGVRIVYVALEALLTGRIGADLALAQACVAALFLGDHLVAAEVVFIALLGESLEAITAESALRAIGRLFAQRPARPASGARGWKSRFPSRRSLSATS